MNGDTFRQILELLRRLEEARIHHRLDQSRDDAIRIDVTVPGERWEIEFVHYGDIVRVEVEKFRSEGKIEDETALDDLFTRFSDEEEALATP